MTVVVVTMDDDGGGDSGGDDSLRDVLECTLFSFLLAAAFHVCWKT
jgi:hypothetical protein